MGREAETVWFPSSARITPEIRAGYVGSRTDRTTPSPPTFENKPAVTWPIVAEGLRLAGLTTQLSSRQNCLADSSRIEG